jgi:uncharacterized protein (TIGR02145 family)
VKRIFLLVNLILIFSFPGYNQSITNVGTDFWIAFPPNTGQATLNLFISSDVATSGTVTSAWPGVNQNFTVVPGIVTQIDLPYTVALSGGVEEKGIRITANDPIAVYGLNRITFLTDAFLALPVNALGTNYMVLSYQTTLENKGSGLSIVATQDETEVSVYNHETGSTDIIYLDEGETYYTEVSDLDEDITGSEIESNYPVAVFGSVKTTLIPSFPCAADDHIVEQMFPIYSWGKNFVTVPTAGRDNSGDIYRILASEDNTDITIDGVMVATLDAREFYEATLLGYNSIHSSKPTLLAQYAKGQVCSGGLTGDPFMMLIPPREQFLTDYTVCTVAGYTTHYINVVAPDFALGTILLDGNPIPVGDFDPIPGTNFYGAQQEVVEGTHVLTSAYPFGIFSYGWNYADSYGYPGGASLSSVATVDSVALSPDTLYGQLNTSNICLTATVYNSLGNPVEGVLVNFNISGISTIVGNAFTNTLGEATYCYTRNGTTPGVDEVYAEVFGIFSDTSIVYWSYLPPCVNPTSGGTIDGTQTHCDTLIGVTVNNSTLPSGHTGTLEYKWQFSLTSDTSGFIDIPSSNVSSLTFDTVPQTTWFKRIARVDCMPDWSGSDTSNTVKVTILPPQPVSISIAASQNDICAGTPVIFEASTQNKGGSPIFTWLVNNIPAGTNDSVFSYTPASGEEISCILLSSETCTSNNPDTSNSIQMNVHPILPVEITIQASETSVCSGQQVTVNATPTNGGIAPGYQWYVNGIPVGTNDPQYAFEPADQDVITCILISSETCTSNNPAISLPITISVLDAPEVFFSACFDTITTSNGKPIWLRGGLPLGGIYSGTGVSAGSGASSDLFYFNPAVADAGSHEITYTYSNAFACEDSAKSSIVNVQFSIFNCGDSLIDIRDTKKYPTVQIGSQCWMAANLNYGTQIATTSPQRDNCVPEKYCYNDNPELCALSAVLYQWNELMQFQTDGGVQGICPPGWHVPTEADWELLFQQYATNGYAGSALKYNGYSGFNGLLPGIRFQNLIWKYAENDPMLHATMFWSSSIHGHDKAWAHGMNEVVFDDDYTPSVSFYPALVSNAFAVRCIQD